MSLEAALHALLASLCPRVYPDVAPEPMPARPFVVYQQIGGEVINPIAHVPDVPDLRHARMQIAVWAATRLDASALARQIEDALRLWTVHRAAPVGALTADYEHDTRLYGARQDFSVWFK